MANPSLSIIMLVYNSELFLREAVQSILNQTYADFELIIINDGSSDKSTQILKSFDDSRIEILSNGTNQGIVFSRNKGLANARGKYIAMFDSDDIAAPLKFEKQIHFLENNLEYGIIGSWVETIDSKGKKRGEAHILTAKPEQIPSILFFRNYFINSATVFRKVLVEDSVYPKGFDIVEDYYLWVYISKKSKVWNLQEFLVEYRIHDNAVTKQDDNLRKAEKKIFSHLFNELGIPQSQHDFEAHMLIKNNEKIQTKANLKEIDKWINLLYIQNSKVKLYKHKAFLKTLFNRWLKVIRNSKHFGLYTIIMFFKARILWLRLFHIISIK